VKIMNWSLTCQHLNYSLPHLCCPHLSCHLSWVDCSVIFGYESCDCTHPRRFKAATEPKSGG
jgi:hypothetical protein